MQTRKKGFDKRGRSVSMSSLPTKPKPKIFETTRKRVGSLLKRFQKASSLTCVTATSSNSSAGDSSSSSEDKPIKNNIQTVKPGEEELTEQSSVDNLSEKSDDAEKGTKERKEKTSEKEAVTPQQDPTKNDNAKHKNPEDKKKKHSSRAIMLENILAAVTGKSEEVKKNRKTLMLNTQESFVVNTETSSSTSTDSNDDDLSAPSDENLNTATFNAEMQADIEAYREEIKIKKENETRKKLGELEKQPLSNTEEKSKTSSHETKKKRKHKEAVTVVPELIAFSILNKPGSTSPTNISPSAKISTSPPSNIEPPAKPITLKNG